MFELNKKEIKDQLDYIRRYLDDELHPVVSPDNWYVYSNLVDELDQLEILLERNGVIEGAV